LEKFARALGLRDLWHECASPEMVWVRTDVPYDDIDKLFFVDCTCITLGDGNKTSFWLSGCLLGKRPKDITPLLFDKTTAPDSPRCISYNSPHSGTSLRVQYFGHKTKTRLPRLYHHKGNTPHHQCTNPNCLIAPPCLHLCLFNGSPYM
jgi:hypothetical protein